MTFMIGARHRKTVSPFGLLVRIQRTGERIRRMRSDPVRLRQTGGGRACSATMNPLRKVMNPVGCDDSVFDSTSG
jgi:hypothetical protein